MSTIDTVARTIWGEARSHGLDGMAAVANVIGNRVADPGWWGADWVTVCRKPWQFSCWNDNDPNRTKLLQVTSADPHFKDALMLSGAAVRGELRDRTKGSDHYFAEWIAAPNWALGKQPTLTLGPAGQKHLFFRIGRSG